VGFVTDRTTCVLVPKYWARHTVERTVGVDRSRTRDHDRSLRILVDMTVTIDRTSLGLRGDLSLTFLVGFVDVLKDHGTCNPREDTLFTVTPGMRVHGCEDDCSSNDELLHGEFLSY
jgi:hypothetical protein